MSPTFFLGMGYIKMPEFGLLSNAASLLEYDNAIRECEG